MFMLLAFLGALCSILSLELLYERVVEASISGLVRKCHSLRGKKQEELKQTAVLKKQAGLPCTGRQRDLGKTGAVGGGRGRGEQPMYSKRSLPSKGNKSRTLPRTVTLPCGILPSDLQIINPEAAK